MLRWAWVVSTYQSLSFPLFVVAIRFKFIPRLPSQVFMDEHFTASSPHPWLSTLPVNHFNIDLFSSFYDITFTTSPLSLYFLDTIFQYWFNVAENGGGCEEVHCTAHTKAQR